MAEVQLKVCGLMTAPRHEITLARTFISKSLAAAGVPLAISGGVFYGQNMQRMLEDAIAGGGDVALTIDFDSMFTPQDVQRLLRVLVESEGIDAVAGMQARRGQRFPLLTVGGKTSQIIDGNPFRVDTAHFGLTAIDLHRLKDVPKPWFFAQPDSNGGWSEAKIDDDIWFWRQWAKAGRTIYIDPQCRIGHMEEMVTYFDERMQIHHAYPSEWADEAYGLKPEKEGTLVFVGANRASEKLVRMVDRHSRSYLFEPLPDIAESLRAAFHGRDEVTVIEAACGQQCEKRKLHRYNQNGESSSFGVVTQQAKDAWPAVDWSETQEIEVHVFNLYDWWYSCEIGPIDTLVIDAQGMDLTILRSVKPLLELGQIKRIQAEADGNGFQHYSGLPKNSVSDFEEFMAAFPWYVGSKMPNTVEWQPDLVWGFDENIFAEVHGASGDMATEDCAGEHAMAD